MTLTFEPISLERQAAYRALFGRCSVRPALECFVSLWGWTDTYAMEWAWEDFLVWPRQTGPVPLRFAPVGEWHGVDWKTHLQREFPEPTEFFAVPEELADLWAKALPERVVRTEQRGQWEYLHRVSDLAQLSGNAFMKRRQKYNQFLRLHEGRFRYRSLTREAIPAVVAFQERWMERFGDTSPRDLGAEHKAILRILSAWEKLDGLLGGVLDVDGVIVAYTVAGVLDATTVAIHFEKACPDVPGAYQAINRMFLAAEGTPFVLANREEDLDDPGIRQAKLSYRPVAFLRKETVLLR